MRFKIDHDLHIHSYLSSCSHDPNQTAERILRYGEQNGLNTVCITDHHWDARIEGMSDWYKKQGDIFSVLPLPQSDKCRFLFGCETDMDKHFRIGLSQEEMEKYDFFIVPTTHLHMKNFTFDECHDNVADKTVLYIKRFEAFLNADLPFHKVGLAHITCSLIHREEGGYLKVLDGVSDSKFEELFRGCAERGCGVELNFAIPEASATEWLTPSGCGYTLLASHFLWMSGRKLEAIKEIPDLPEEKKEGNYYDGWDYYPNDDDFDISEYLND